MAASPVTVTWSFPGLWVQPTGESWLPTPMLHLYGRIPAVVGPYEMDAACAALTNTSSTAQSITVVGSAPGFGADSTQSVSVLPGTPRTVCVNPGWDPTVIYPLRSFSTGSLQAVVRDRSGNELSRTTRAFSAMPLNSFVWNQFGGADDGYLRAGPLASVFVMPNDGAVTTMRTNVEMRSIFPGHFGVTSWSTTTHSYSRETYNRTQSVPGGSWAPPEMFYLEAGESFSFTLVSSSGGTDGLVDATLFTDVQYNAWATGAGMMASQAWPSVTSGAHGTFMATSAGWYVFVLSGTRNVLSRSVVWTRSNSRADVVLDALQAIFAELRAEGVIYRNLGAGEGTGYQTISLPPDSIAAHAANCIDGTLLFASLLENIGFDPTIILVHGHAYVGAHSIPLRFGGGTLWPVETTDVGFTSQTFFDAVTCAINNCVVPTTPFHVYIEVATARTNGVQAIPRTH